MYIPYGQRMKKNIPRALRAGLYFLGALMAIGLLALAAYLYLVLFAPARVKDVEYFAIRAKNAFSHLIMKEKPGFYYLILEKSGQDFKLTKDDKFDVYYRDEFVIKEIVSDAIAGKGVTVDVEGLGTGNDYQTPLRGIELVDKTIEGLVTEKGKRELTPFRILVKYEGEAIAEIPVAVELTPQDWLRHARATKDEGEQINYLKKALAMNKADTAVRKTLAGLYEKRGMRAEAVVQYRELIQLQPGEAGHWQELLRIHQESKDYEEVVKSSQHIIKINPGDNNARLNMALAYESLGKRDKVIETYQEALKNDAANPVIHYRLGETYEKAGAFGKAAEHYKAALSKRPQDHNIMMALAEASIKGGNQDEAIKWFKEILKVQPRNAAVWANLGAAYGVKGLVKDEIDSYRKSLALRNDQTVRFNLAAAYEKSKMDKEAAEEYRNILGKRAPDPDVLERLANALFRLKDFKEASSRYEELVKLSKKNRQMAHVHLNMGFAYGELKKYSQSAKSYEAALDQGLKDPIIYYNLAVTYEELKNEKKAMEAYERHASLQPTLEVLDKLARHYEDKGQFENAIKAYLRLEKMTTGASGKAFYFLSMGDIAVKQGNPDKAIEYFRNSLKYNPKDGEIYFRRAEAYEKKKMYQEARQDYQMALEYGASLDQAKRKIYEMGVKITQQKFNKEQ